MSMFSPLSKKKNINNSPKGEPVSINTVLWPEGGVVDEELLRQSNYLEGVLHDWRLRSKFLRERSLDVSEVYVYVATTWPEWQRKALEALQSLYRQV